jgi:hypothetical protein
MNPIRDLELVILNYESQYFSASSLEVTGYEAAYIAMILMYDLISVVRYCGNMRCDGLELASMLDMIRF